MANESWTLITHEGATTTLLNEENDALWLSANRLRDVLGWEVKDGALCREDRCVGVGAEMVRPDSVELNAVARLLHMPLVAAAAHRMAALADAPEDRAAVLLDGAAPDFELPDMSGQTHRLSDYRGRKVLLVTWASWCGCREDLGGWRALHDELQGAGLTVMTVSQDIRAADAEPYITRAEPSHPALLDEDHVVSHRYGLINVPTAVWIDEDGRIARPPRVEHASNVFSFAHGLDCEPHQAALRRWVATGERDIAGEQARRSTLQPTFDEQLARAHHMLAWRLYKAGAEEDAAAHWQLAVELSPYDWTIRRGIMPLRGQDPFGAEFVEYWMEWEKAGRPDYQRLAAARQG
jgi:peroxiredoxin